MSLQKIPVKKISGQYQGIYEFHCAKAKSLKCNRVYAVMIITSIVMPLHCCNNSKPVLLWSCIFGNTRSGLDFLIFSSPSVTPEAEQGSVNPELISFFSISRIILPWISSSIMIGLQASCMAHLD